MSRKKIAIQGELGAYSHIAAENLYKDSEIKTCTTFEETFKPVSYTHLTLPTMDSV